MQFWFYQAYIKYILYKKVFYYFIIDIEHV